MYIYFLVSSERLIQVDLYEKIKELAAQRKVSIRQIEEFFGWGNGVINRWRTSKPAIDKVQRVADYFHVSVDYLLGREEKSESLDSIEENLLAAFRINSQNMSFEEKSKLNNSLKGMMELAQGMLNDDSKWKK